MPSCIFMNLRGLCGQSSPNYPRFFSCRIVLLLTYIVATIVIPSYSASLTRYLSSKPIEVIKTDLKDFYRTGSHKIMVVDGSYEFYVYNSLSNQKALREVNKAPEEDETLPKTYKEALLMTCESSNTAVFTVSSTMNWEMSKAENAYLNEKCSLRNMIQNAGVIYNGIIYSKNSRYRKLIDYHLKNLKKTGIINRLQKKYWRNKPILRSKHWESVSLENSSAVFQIISCGAVLSFFFIIFERFLNNPNRGKTKKKVSLGFINFTFFLCI